MFDGTEAKYEIDGMPDPPEELTTTLAVADFEIPPKLPTTETSPVMFMSPEVSVTEAPEVRFRVPIEDGAGDQTKLTPEVIVVPFVLIAEAANSWDREKPSDTESGEISTACSV